MPSPLPPYALRAPVFRFRHLAALAGRAPIGGAREVALACLVTARMAADAGDDTLDLSPAARDARAAGARSWLGALTLPAPVRLAAQRLASAGALDDARAAAREIAALGAASAEYLDGGSRAELAALAASLGA